MTTAIDADLVRDGGRFPTEPQRWHLIERTTEAGVFVTECGEHVDDATDRSQPGESPDNLTGNTVCYDCANDRHAGLDG